ncbi:Hypp1353 [Branchiostoma lanceolatum]|uniref:Hypp1353 protein n=1 Tax=Branchiostoma lanceolatum TaxID=7740 RepID=A0A8J9ZH51_BRALA|nr:Hypp1353 [Branchiostoma lanceolatum]
MAVKQWDPGSNPRVVPRDMSELAPRRCALGKGTLHAFPPQSEGQVSNSSCLQLADESSARRAGVIKADLECKSHPAVRCKHPNQNQHVSLELVPLEKADAQSQRLRDVCDFYNTCDNTTEKQMPAGSSYWRQGGRFGRKTS